MKETPTLLTSSTKIAKHSILSTIYLAGLTGCMLICPDFNSALGVKNVTAIFSLLVVLAVLLTYVSYEIVMPLNRKLFIPKVVKGFQITNWHEKAKNTGGR